MYPKSPIGVACCEGTNGTISTVSSWMPLAPSVQLRPSKCSGLSDLMTYASSLKAKQVTI